MQYRQLGASDLNVSEISLGSWLTYSGGIEAERAASCVRAALSHGVNFIDTANIYGRGAAETFLGEVLSDVDRKSYVLATKLYFPMTDTDRGLSRAQIEKQIDASLKRLRTDYVDLYQCHRYDDETPLDETLQALTDVVKAGKARYLGFSEWPIDKVQAAINAVGVEHFVSSQPQYSMMWPTPEVALFPLCAAHGISQIVWSPLAQGLLTGKYLPGKPVPTDSRAASSSMGSMLPKFWLEAPVLEAVQAVKSVAAEAGLDLPAFALAWVLRQKNVASAIIGATRPEQVAANVAASGAVVDPALFAKAEALLKPYAGRWS